VENRLYQGRFPLRSYRNITYRSIFFCVEVISSTLVLRKQKNTLGFGTTRLKWKTGLHLNHRLAINLLSHIHTTVYHILQINSCQTEPAGIHFLHQTTMTRCDSTQKFKNKICHILNQSNLYWWFAINRLRFTRQRHGGHVGANHAPIPN
jgi:hypothetical protein